LSFCEVMISKTAAFVILVLALLVRIGLRVKLLLASPPVQLNDARCELVGEDILSGSEDLALGREAILFITSGDLKKTFYTGAASADPGGIFALDMRGSSRSPVQLPLENFPSGVRFQPHGLDISNSSDHLLTTSHAGNHSRVEIFRIEYHPNCLEHDPWSCTPVTLHHINSIISDLFPNCGINDVVEGASPHELYVTQWLSHSFPEHGMPPGLNFKNELAPLLLNLIGFSWTRVFRCTWSEDVPGGECEPATGRIFYGANGITISEDRTQLFVSDPIAKRISIMNRQEDGSLMETGHIDLPWAVDNIEMEGGDLVMGSITDIGKVIQAKEDVGKEDPSLRVAVPGGMLVARMEDGEWKLDKEHVLSHDGSKLSSISSAARWGNKVVLGSPFSRGLLLCP